MIKRIFTLALFVCSAATMFGQWSVENVSLERRDMGVGTANGKVFFAGGVPANSVVDYATYRKRVDIYDIATDTWTEENLSVERQYTFAVGVGNKMYFAGYTQTLADNQDVVEVYDTQSGSWSTITMPSIDGAVSVTAEQGLIFFVHDDNVDVYDTSNGSWSYKQLSVDRILVTAVGCNGKVLFAGGGFAAGTIYDLVDIYDIDANTWTTASLSEGRNQIPTACIGDKAYFVGGYLGFPGYSTNIDVYDTESEEWSLLNLNFEKSGFGLATNGNNLFVAGGYDNSEFDYLSEVEIIDVTNGSKTMDNLSEARSGVRATAAGNKLFFGGGSAGSSTYFDIVDVYVGDASSIPNLDNAKFNLYPNPVEDVLFIDYDGLGAIEMDYKLYNALGQLITEGVVQNELNLSGLNAGIYYLELNGDAVAGRKKFIKL